MNFSTVTKSGVFQYVLTDITKTQPVHEIESKIIEMFNNRYLNKGIHVELYSEYIPLSFIVVAESYYNSECTKNQHPHYNEIVLSTGYLNSIAGDLNLKCTRKGT